MYILIRNKKMRGCYLVKVPSQIMLIVMKFGKYSFLLSKPELESNFETGSNQKVPAPQRFTARLKTNYMCQT